MNFRNISEDITIYIVSLTTHVGIKLSFFLFIWEIHLLIKKEECTFFNEVSDPPPTHPPTHPNLGLTVNLIICPFKWPCDNWWISISFIASSHPHFFFFSYNHMNLSQQLTSYRKLKVFKFQPVCQQTAGMTFSFRDLLLVRAWHQWSCLKGLKGLVLNPSVCLKESASINLAVVYWILYSAMDCG